MVRLGTGIGWRPEIADDIARLPGIDWVEVVAENICPDHVPDALRLLRERGTTVVPHGVSLGLGGAERPEPGRLRALAERAEALGSPLVTEHIAFVRAGGPLTASPSIEAGHLLPVPRTRDALDVLCENVRIAQDALPVPLAVENIAALISWPGEEMTEGQFLAELVERTGVRLLIDVANLHTNHVNRGEDPAKALDELPTSAIAYVHVAGGVEKDGVWHDSHAHPVTQPVLDVLAELCARTAPPGVLLERDEDFPTAGELAGELAAIRAVTAAGAAGAAEAGMATAGTAAGSAEPVTAAGAAEAATAAGTGEEAPAPVRASAAADEADKADKARTGADVPAADAPAADAPAPEAPLPDAPLPEAPVPDAVRERLALAQTALLSALVGDTPPPEGFDRRRLRVQSAALTAKRASVIAKVAPELPEILGTGYRPAFARYAEGRPMTGGYRRDALSFAEHLLADGRPGDSAARRRLTLWWQERSGPAPLPSHPAARFARRVRLALSGGR
ncbi:hypothetical protein GCM10009548_68660 [Streptomyces malaysiensis subsp. malaysiensis]|uniref:DUF692 domain-containing protein n=1 Tax=Streptomyces malaysiensis TaxID=92644 RepID=A0ABX6WCH1_STRMQ|nr:MULTISPECIES: DUF692 domain-containing protein [Streptomyces]QPI59145.1 DUF692 domain-containing protein [Streptomyces solisilvae]UHH20790.1 DUF692 domain-containing protein [Streptomyces sp. HNM0561]